MLHKETKQNYINQKKKTNQKEKKQKRREKNSKFRPDSNRGSPIQWAILLPLRHGDILYCKLCDITCILFKAFQLELPPARPV